MLVIVLMWLLLYGIPSDISNYFCLQWGGGNGNKSSWTFPITFTTIYSLTSNITGTAGNYYDPSRYPRDYTTTGFTTTALTDGKHNLYYIATGNKS